MIGGEQVETEMTKLLNNQNKYIRATATEVLGELQGTRALPLLRKMFIEENFGDRPTALTYLAKYGTPDDLLLLMPFWEKHYGYGFHIKNWDVTPNPQEAIKAIREKYNYDINGPIKKEKVADGTMSSQ